MNEPHPHQPLRTRCRRAAAELGPALPLFLFAFVGPLVGASVLAATTRDWLPLLAGDAAAAVAFVALGVVATAGCLLPTHATSLVAGFVFGAGLGSFVAWVVVVAASLAGFVVLQRVVGERVLHAVAGTRRGAVVHRALLGRGFVRSVWLIALLRLSPLMPFGVTNLLLAALRVAGPTFLVATLLGATPRAIAVALLGAGLSELDWQAKGSAWWTAFAVVATVVVLVVIGRTARRALRDELAAGPPS